MWHNGEVCAEKRLGKLNLQMSERLQFRPASVSKNVLLVLVLSPAPPPRKTLARNLKLKITYGWELRSYSLCSDELRIIKL